MNKDEFLVFFDDFTEQMRDTIVKKNHDYTNAGSSTFENFESVEKVGICTVTQGFLTRMMDKMMRLTTVAYGRELQVKDEKVKDTLQDLANYTILLAGYLSTRKKSS